MAQQSVSDNSPAIALFPEYAALYELIAPEVRGLTDAQLDWESDTWEWSKWSIRRQLSHMASLLYRWMLLRWGDTLFPDGNHGVENVKGIARSDFDRRMDENKYHDLDDILGKLKEGIALAQSVMSMHTVGFLRSKTLPYQGSNQWDIMRKAHPTGFEIASDGGESTINLEATFRHMYFEETTHLYNIQRLKRAQGLSTVVDVPKVGYWVQDGWDRSEP